MDPFLCSLSFVFLTVAVLVSPWFFAAWEMWWFWPFAVLLFLSAAAFALRLVLRAFSRRDDLSVPAGGNNPGRLGVLLLYALFLVYVGARCLGAGVYLDAERSLLLFLTPFLIGIQVVYGFTTRQRRRLFTLVLVDLCLLGIYGLVNHRLTGNTLVLWREGYEQYFRDNRATGSYFCPNHFAGIMELALSIGLALLVTRRVPWMWKLWGGGAAMIGGAGILLSKSRGGGLSAVLVAFVILIWGFRRYRSSVRTWWRLSLACAMAIGLVLLAGVGSDYTERFSAFFEKGPDADRTPPVTKVWRAVRRSVRGQMYAGALRAWQTAPVFGIGPGMHQILWPHFAAASDGDRDLGIWPSEVSTKIHSYEVHNDWLQLLEEYGIVGFLLFMLPAAAAAWLLHLACWRETRRKGNRRFLVTDGTRHAVVLGAFASLAAIAFHSLGDFNLQMPATVWLFASILSLGLFHATEQEEPRTSEEPEPVPH